jgi:hypothetical protein
MWHCEAADVDARLASWCGRPPVLDAAEQRVQGSRLEKEITVSAFSRSAACCWTHFTGLVSRTVTAPPHRLPRSGRSAALAPARMTPPTPSSRTPPAAGSCADRRCRLVALERFTPPSGEAALPDVRARARSIRFSQGYELTRLARADPRSRSAHQDHEHLRNGVR